MVNDRFVIYSDNNKYDVLYLPDTFQKENRKIYSRVLKNQTATMVVREEAT